MGRPKGSKNDTIWRDTLRRISLEYAEGNSGPKKIELAARKLVEAVLSGDIPAIKEYGNRIDGMPKQIIDAVITDERMVVEAPEPAATADAWADQYAKPN